MLVGALLVDLMKLYCSDVVYNTNVDIVDIVDNVDNTNVLLVLTESLYILHIYRSGMADLIGMIYLWVQSTGKNNSMVTLPPCHIYNMEYHQ